MGEDFEAGAHGAAFGIVGSVDEARDACLDDGAGAHAARLDGDVERGAREAVISKKAGGFAENEDFGVGSGVAIADGAVTGTRQSLPVVDEDSADGDLAGGRRGASFGQRFLHELDVRFHAGRENNMWTLQETEFTLKAVENTPYAEKREVGVCLTIAEGRNKLGACGNSWNDCFKSIF